jgi:hypothetical protein
MWDLPFLFHLTISSRLFLPNNGRPVKRRCSPLPLPSFLCDVAVGRWSSGSWCSHPATSVRQFWWCRLNGGSSENYFYVIHKTQALPTLEDLLPHFWGNKLFYYLSNISSSILWLIVVKDILSFIPFVDKDPEAQGVLVTCLVLHRLRWHFLISNPDFWMLHLLAEASYLFMKLQEFLSLVAGEPLSYH